MVLRESAPQGRRPQAAGPGGARRTARWAVSSGGARRFRRSRNGLRPGVCPLQGAAEGKKEKPRQSKAFPNQNNFTVSRFADRKFT